MMHSGKMAAAALAVVAGFVLGSQAVAAGEGGTFRMLTSGVHDFTTVDQAGEKFTAGDLTGTVSVIQSSGGAFPEGATYLATCVLYATISKASTDLRGACTMTAASGDSWFALATRKAGDIEDVGTVEGRWELSGGTGSYAGITGGCPYETTFLPGDRAVSTADCTWER